MQRVGVETVRDDVDDGPAEVPRRLPLLLALRHLCSLGHLLTR